MVCTGLMSLIEVSDKIFIIWVFHSWLKIAFLILKGYQHNSNHINHIRVISIKHVQLKLLTSKNGLVLVSILGVLFIMGAVISTAGESISDTVDYF